MQEENEYVQDEVVEQEEITTTEEATESDDTVTLSKSEFNKLRRQAIAYKANKEAPRQEIKETQTTTNSLSEEEIEAKILLSQGKSPELIEEMKALARVRGKSLLQVQNDPILVAMEQARESEVKAKQARLGVSRGSTTVKPSKSFATPGLSEADFKELWKEANNK